MLKTGCKILASCALLYTAVFAEQVIAAGTLVKTSVMGASLQGNLEGNSAERDVYVYLPEGYANSDKHYPVVYFLHGYGVGAHVYVDDVLHMPASVDQVMTPDSDEMIIVMPDAFTRFGGSFYSNSPTIGDWESFIARDLISWVDSHYRTIPKRESRGLSGHSMGGYGTLRIGMEHPEVFGALYIMSAGALINKAPDVNKVKEQLIRMQAGIKTQERSTANGVQAQAAAWAPNPQNPPYYFDLPYNANGEVQPLIAEKWLTNALLYTVDQHVPALQSYRAISLDVGNEDTLEAENTLLDAAFTRLNIEHSYAIYAGNHGNKVGQRFIENVLPFFAQHLDAE